MVIGKISAANIVPHMLAPKNSVGTKSEQAAACLSELHNPTEVGSCSPKMLCHMWKQY